MENSSERRFKPLEIADIIRRAGQLYEWNQDEKEGERLKEITKALPLGEQPIPLSEAFKLAEQEGIPKEYVEKTVELIYTPKKDVIESIRKFQAVPSGHVRRMVFSQLYQVMQEPILTSLRMSFPMFNFSKVYPNDSKEDIYGNFGFYKVNQITKTRGLIFKKKKIFLERELWGKLFSSSDYGIEVVCQNYHFLNACKETVNETRKKLSELDLEVYFHLTYNFDPAE